MSDVWGDAPPARPAGAVHAYVSKLRRILEPHRAPRASATVLVSRSPGYVLNVDVDAVDGLRFEALVIKSRGLASDDAVKVLDEALALWRGPVLADFSFEPWVAAPAARYDELRASAVEARFGALLDLGRHTEVIADLWDAVAAAPLRERLWALLMVGAVPRWPTVRSAGRLSARPASPRGGVGHRSRSGVAVARAAGARPCLIAVRRGRSDADQPRGHDCRCAEAVRSPSGGRPRWTGQRSWPRSEGSSKASEPARRGRSSSADRPVWGRRAWSRPRMRRANIRTSRWCGDVVWTGPRRPRCGRGSRLRRRLVRPVMRWPMRSTPTPAGSGIVDQAARGRAYESGRGRAVACVFASGR